MGYACPVCAAPQADGEHLANHLAFSALLGHEDHADWLDEHAPGWGDDDPDELARRVVDRCDPVEYPEVFEDTTGDRPDVDVGAHGHDHPPASPRQTPDPGVLDPEARDALREAHDMTERRREGDGEGGDSDGESGK